MNLSTEPEIGRCIYREAHDAILLLDPATLRILDANPSAQRLTGHRRKELITLDLRDLFHCPVDGELQALQRACGSTSCFASGDGYFAKTAKGALLPIHVRVSRIHTEPNPLGLVIAWDLTRQKQAEEARRKIEHQMQQSQRLESLGVMAGGIAHDFNNLLTGILGNAELAGFNLPKESVIRNHLDQIVATTHRATGLVRQLLAYSGQTAIDMRPTRLSDLAAEIGQLMRVSMSKNVVMTFALAPDGPICKGDGAQLSQVIMNLVVNAAEAIGARPGIVCLSTRIEHCNRDFFKNCYLNDQLPEGEYACLEVSDSGSGMDAATLSRIFEPFFTTKFTGRGLGLAAVLGIVRAHRGTIQIESRPGHGTKFRVYIPSTREPVRPPEPPEPPDLNWRGSGRVMVVDDEESLRSSAREMLERLGFEVALAGDGFEGLELLRAGRGSIRAIMLDVAMPRMNGAEMAREVRRMGGTMPLIVTSGFDQQITHQAFAAGEVTAFVQKPYAYRDLHAVFSKCLPGHTGDNSKTVGRLNAAP